MRSLAHMGRGLLAGAALTVLSCNTTKDGLRVSALFETAAGLKRGTPVEVAGVPIGEVEDIRLEQMKARVLVRIDRQVEVSAGSNLRIEGRGLVGDRVVILVPGSGPPAADRGELHGEVSNDQITIRATEVFDRVNAMMADVQAVTAILRKAAEKDGPAGLRPMLGDPAPKPAP